MSTFTRTPEQDRRIGRGDDFAGDAWTDAAGAITYTVVGGRPADTRAAAERVYDDLKSGAAYVKPADGEIEIARECDQAIATHRAADKPELPRFPRDGSDADVLRWREQVRQFGSPLFNDLLDWVTAHIDAEQAACERDEQPTPPIIVDILETLEAHLDQKGAAA